MSLQFIKLQNGSDIRGVAMSGSVNEDITLTTDHVSYIALAFGLWLSEQTNIDTDNLSISVGMDSRITGPKLQAAIVKSLSSLGITTYICGIATTPSMFMSTKFRKHNCDGAIMITASHLPFNRNGMKFFTRQGGLDHSDISKILTTATDLNTSNFTATKEGAIIPYKLIDVYADYLIHRVRKATSDLTPLEGLKIIVDAGNGAGGFFATKILKQLGANTTGSQYLDPDGMFPNHIPNPEDAEAMASIQKATIENNADLGIIFDTDVDRAAVVDYGGKIINRNALIALMSAIVLEEYPKTTIVTDSVTSDSLTKFIHAKGGIHHRFKRGYKNVINESRRLNHEGTESVLAIETSGHGALKENYFLDDGAYTVVKIIIKLAQLKKEGLYLSTLIEELIPPLEAKEFRVKIQTPDYKTYGSKIITDLEAYFKDKPGYNIAENNYEGVRVTSDHGWFLLRLSLHDPILPINIESTQYGGSNMMLEDLKVFLSGYDLLQKI